MACRHAISRHQFSVRISDRYSLCQSGRSAAALLGLAIAAIAPQALAGQTGWAHQDAAFSSNGAVTIKGLAGGAYVGTQNPAGAVAKANQSAVTQAPTVIIQATATSGNVEAIPLLSGSATPPSCPAGYTATVTRSGAGCPVSIWNVGGTRFSLIYNGGSMVSFGTENFPVSSSGGNWPATTPAAVCTGSWSAVLCTR